MVWKVGSNIASEITRSYSPTIKRRVDHLFHRWSDASPMSLGLALATILFSEEPYDEPARCTDKDVSSSEALPFMLICKKCIRR
jgi:hypothetical protein